MKRMFLAGLAALTVLAAGCSKDNTGGTDVGTASMRVKIKGENNGSRAIGTPTQTEENHVESFTVFVFNNSTGAREALQTFPNGVTEGTIANLNVATSKRVVVFVNMPESYPATSITSYTDLAAAANYLSLDTQQGIDLSTGGLFMSGEAPVTLSTTTENTVTIPVSRLVAKVRIGNLAVIPEDGLALGDFVLQGVSIQRTRLNSPVLGGLATTGFTYGSGVVLSGQTETQEDYLYQAYALPGGYNEEVLQPNVYFYVFPNDNTNGMATLVSLYGTYQNVDMYYSFFINGEASGTGDNAPDGNWIERNKIYTLNVTLRKLDEGGDNPNVPNEQVTLDVEIDVADWETEIIQDVEW